MLGIEARDTRAMGRLRKFVEWRVSLAQSDNVLAGLRNGKEFPESPHATEVERCMRRTAFPPDGFQSAGIKAGGPPGRVGNLEQMATLRAAEVLRRNGVDGSAADAAELESDRGGGLLRAGSTRASSRSGGERHGVASYFSPRKYWSVRLIQSARGGVKTSRSTVSSSASALCGMCAGMQRTSPACTTISLPSIQNFKAPSRM